METKGNRGIVEKISANLGLRNFEVMEANGNGGDNIALSCLWKDERTLCCEVDGHENLKR